MLISNSYKEQCTLLHQQDPKWGNLNKYPELLASNLQIITNLWERQGKGTVLDYGCGKGWLAQHFPAPVQEYDPGIPGKDQSPEPSELVICLDVLEHIELEYLDNVLKDLQRVTSRRGLFTIACRPATAILPDGRNAHLIIEDSDWWLKKLLNYFHIEYFTSANQSLNTVVKRLHDGTY